MRVATLYEPSISKLGKEIDNAGQNQFPGEATIETVETQVTGGDKERLFSQGIQSPEGE